jgi:hypothetical protein
MQTGHHHLDTSLQDRDRDTSLSCFYAVSLSVAREMPGSFVRHDRDRILQNNHLTAIDDDLFRWYITPEYN